MLRWRASMALVVALLACGLAAAGAQQDCRPGFGLSSSGECVKCNQTAGHQPLCLLCDGDDPSFCYDCATLTSYFKYTSISGYYADSEGICQRCPDTGFELSSEFVGQHPCIACANLNGTCTECIRGYGVVAGECVKCEVADAECVSCDGNAAVCTACTSSRGLVDGTCQQCTVDNCDNCEGNTAVCTACGSGHRLVDGTCQQCAVENCANCDDNTEVCTACSYGHGLVDGTCQQCAIWGCANCDGNTASCLTCNDATYWDAASSKCLQDF